MPCQLFTDADGGYTRQTKQAPMKSTKFDAALAQIADKALPPDESFPLRFHAAFDEMTSYHYKDDRAFYWQDVIINMICGEMGSACTFMKDGISEDEFIWLSEYAVRVAEKSADKGFIEALQAAAEKYADAVKLFGLAPSIEKASQAVSGA